MTTTTLSDSLIEADFARLLHSIPDPLRCDQCGRNSFVRFITADEGKTMRQRLCYYCKWPDPCEFDYAPPSIQNEIRLVTDALENRLGVNRVLNFVYRT